MIYVFLLFSAIWLATGLCMLVNIRHLKRVADLPLPDRDRWPGVSVVVPARNEETGLAEAMQRGLAADYPDIEVIVVDDRSTDRTGAIADDLARSDPRVRVIHNDALPEGWLGKVHALNLGAQRATKEWLLFSDADVHLDASVLRRVIGHGEARRLDVLAAMPSFVSRSPWLTALYAVLMRIMFAAMFVKLIENPRSAYGSGVGAFTLVRRRALLNSPGLPAIRLEVADDLMLGRMLKRSGARCTILNGAHAIRVELYKSVSAFVIGAEKNAWAVSARFSLVRGIGFFLALLAVDLSPLALAVAMAATPHFVPGAALLGWAALISMIALRANGQKPWAGLFYVAGSAIFLYAMLRGTVLGYRRGGLQWRGTFYPTSVFLSRAATKTGTDLPAADG